MAGHIGKDLEVDTDEDTEERSAMDMVTVTGNNEVIFSFYKYTKPNWAFKFTSQKCEGLIKIDT